MFNRLLQEERLLFTEFPKDWDHYDMTELLFQPKAMSGADLLHGIDSGSAAWNRPWQLVSRYLKTLRTTRSFSTAMFALGSNLNYRQVGKGKKMEQAESCAKPEIFGKRKEMTEK